MLDPGLEIEDEAERFARERREAHSQSEQRRRQAINAAIEDLRGRVQANPYDSKAAVLAHVIRRIEGLENENAALREQNNLLRREIALFRRKESTDTTPSPVEERYLPLGPSMALPTSSVMGTRRSLPRIHDLAISSSRGFTDLPAPISPGIQPTASSSFQLPPITLAPLAGPSSPPSGSTFSTSGYRFPGPLPSMPKRRRSGDSVQSSRQESTSSSSRSAFQY